MVFNKLTTQTKTLHKIRFTNINDVLAYMIRQNRQIEILFRVVIFIYHPSCKYTNIKPLRGL